MRSVGRAGRPWKLCFNDDCPTMVEMREKKAERLAAQEAAKKAKELDEAEAKIFFMFMIFEVTKLKKI